MQLRHPMITQINDHIWLMNDNNEATGYVVAGNQSAMVIDTMLGMVNVKEEAERLTDLPLICVNTHGHFDHIGGNWSFDKVYINFEDLSLAKETLAMPEIQATTRQFGFQYPEYLQIEDGQIFDLGGLELQAYYLPGHTAGEIVLLDRADRILFSGDGVIEQIWMQLPESLPIRTQIQSMQRIQHLRTEFDSILTGHSRCAEKAELFDALLEAAIDLDNGNTAGDVEYQWFGGTCMAHPYGKEPRRIAYKSN
ncbi:MAG: MBL fold metallo-hydrolase [Lachnospiraceae bacterium]|nr:MBL fold metallo-hydrolase [Lachnospiraceae bacterium]